MVRGTSPPGAAPPARGIASAALPLYLTMITASLGALVDTARTRSREVAGTGG